MLDWGWWLGQGDLLVGWLVKLLSSSVWRNRKCTFYDIVACCFLMLHVSVCVSISPAFRLSLSKKLLVWYYLHWHVCEWEFIFSVYFQPVILLIAILDLSVFSPAWQFTNPEAVQTSFFLLLFLHQPDSLPNQKLFKCLFFPFCFSTSLTVYQSRSCSNLLMIMENLRPLNTFWNMLCQTMIGQVCSLISPSAYLSVFLSIDTWVDRMMLGWWALFVSVAHQQSLMFTGCWVRR